tara:strand:+ start:626 stop:1153 length:528 start_codon:yes stop_codon:yes gene_type:complete
MNNILLRELKPNRLFSLEDDITYPKSLFTPFTLIHISFAIIWFMLIKKIFNLSSIQTSIIVFILFTIYEIKDLICLFEKKPELNEFIPNFMKPFIDFCIKTTFLLYYNLTYLSKEEIYCCNSLPNTISDIFANTIGILIALLYEKNINQISISTSILLFIIVYIIAHVLYKFKIH